MATKNAKLHKAKREKNDEFYTSLNDITREVSNYWPEIEKLEKELGRKVRIWANCDDEKWSMFTRYFKAQTYFHPNYEFKSTGYQLIPQFDGLNIELYEQYKDEQGNLWKKENLDKPWTKLDENEEVRTYDYMFVDQDGFAKGDFRAKEQEALWQWADIIITNPPFSLFREFMAFIVKYNKKFLLIAPQICLTYKEIIPIVISKNLWLGINQVKNFQQTNNEIKKLGNVSWVTNLRTPFENRELYLTESYYKNPEKYQKADNMDCLYINKVKEIPFDYEGYMAVPISFMTKYNENQFKIYNISRYWYYGWDKSFDLVLNGKETFMKLIIKNRKLIKKNEL